MNTDAIVYDQIMQQITAIPRDRILSPSMPMDAYIQDAHLLYQWAQDDRNDLLNAGLLETLIDDLPYRADVAREAQTTWRNFLQGQSEAQQRWSMESAEAYDLRDELIHVMRYAYRGHEDLMAQLRTISGHGKNFDLVSDLCELANMGRDNLQPLREAGFNLARLEQAAAVSQGMRNLMVNATGTDNLIKQVRDQAYTFLKEAVDAIRECGLCVFWQNPNRRKGYESNMAHRTVADQKDISQPFFQNASSRKG